MLTHTNSVDQYQVTAVQVGQRQLQLDVVLDCMHRNVEDATVNLELFVRADTIAVGG